MNAQQRRDYILERLKAAAQPVSATALAGELGVSRQIIVGDVALLRAGGAEITATPRGYMARRPAGLVRQAAVQHRPEEMERELNAIVDAGGEVVDVIVEHPVYGQLTGVLRLRSRYDVAEFLRRVAEHEAKPLSGLTGGIHLHTIRCPDGDTYQRVIKALENQGFLLKMR